MAHQVEQTLEGFRRRWYVLIPPSAHPEDRVGKHATHDQAISMELVMEKYGLRKPGRRSSDTVVEDEVAALLATINGRERGLTREQVIDLVWSEGYRFLPGKSDGSPAEYTLALLEVHLSSLLVAYDAAAASEGATNEDRSLAEKTREMLTELYSRPVALTPREVLKEFMRIVRRAQGDATAVAIHQGETKVMVLLQGVTQVVIATLAGPPEVS